MLFIVVAILSIGLLMVFSASPTMALKIGDSYYYLKRHIFALTVGLFALYVGLKMDYKILYKWASYLITAAIILLLIVLIPTIGKDISGAKSWIYLGQISFQPSELAKLALIIFLAKELSLNTVKAVTLPALGMSGIMIMLILLEPDMGTASVFMVTAFTLFYLAGLNMKYIYSFIIASLIAIIPIIIMARYRMNRLLAFLDPGKDPTGKGYQIIQSQIAIGCGGIFGMGLGKSMQKLFYLPQNYTDFIFAILCEEIGLIGAVLVIMLFLAFIARGIKIVRSSPDSFSMLLSGGIVSWLGFQALLNMSVVLGLLPTTGIPLPFISYGGSALVSSLFSMGILLNISQYKTAVDTGDKIA